MYRPIEKILEQINNAFTYHRPAESQAERYNALGDAAKSFAIVIANSTLPGREQEIAITKLEEAVMYANAAIRNEPRLTVVSINGKEP